MTSNIDRPKQTPLSEREREILQLVATGLTNREVAQKLSISPNTVKVHLSNIFEKINAASRTEAVLYGIEHGLVEVPGGKTNSEQKQSTWQDTFRKYLWAWIASFVLLSTLIILISTGVIFKTSVNEPVATADVAERWQELEPLPEARVGMAAVAYDQDIFVIAGEGAEGVSGGVFRYSTADEAWSVRRDKPTPVKNIQAAVIGERVFIPGGLTADGSPSDVLEIYDPRQDTWETGASLPIHLSDYALVDFEGQLYLFGGWDGAQAQDGVFIYDPVSDSWEAGTSMPSASQALGAAALEDRLIILGGKNEEGLLDQTWTYYPSRDVESENPWEPFSPMPAGCFGFGTASIYDTIYVFGGQVDDEVENAGAWLMIGEDWIDLEANQDYSGRRVTLVTLGSQLFLLDPMEPLEQTKAWTYQAFYYSIYIPYVP